MCLVLLNITMYIILTSVIACSKEDYFTHTYIYYSRDSENRKPFHISCNKKNKGMYICINNDAKCLLMLIIYAFVGEYFNAKCIF